MKLRVAVLFLGMLGFAHGSADAEAEPEPEPEPEADAQMNYMMPTMPQPQYGMGPGPNAYLDLNNNVVSNGGYMNGGQNNCSMVDTCCQVSNQGCCMGQQQCYTKWERDCQYQSKPFCRTKTERKCFNFQLKKCRITKQTKYYEVPTSKCTPKREKKCWNYKKRVCKRKDSFHEENVFITDEIVTDVGVGPQDKCFPVSTCRIVNITRPVTKIVPQTVCEDVPRPRQVCKTVPVPQQPQTVMRTVCSTEYRGVRQKVPRQRCTTVGCTDYGCQNQMDVCSTSNTVTQNLCGVCESEPCPDYSCQQVQMQQCGTGSCTPGVQQCCTTVYEDVYRSVPCRVSKQVPVTIQPQPVFKQVCETVTTTERICRTVNNPVRYEVPEQKCEMMVEQKCFPINIPEQNVEYDTRNASFKFPTEECDLEEQDEVHCATLEVDVDCRESYVRKPGIISRQVCDQQENRQTCIDIPRSSCENTGGQSCQWVPRRVCQDACSNDNLCNQCSGFVSSGGFGSCNVGSCGNFYGSDAVNGNAYLTQG